MQLKKKFSLKQHNSFHIEAFADFFYEVTHPGLLDDFFLHNKSQLPVLILGGGNNMLFTKDFIGIVLKISFKGIEIISENNQNIYVKAAAGEDWDDFVSFCVQNNWGGLENLSLIPGQVGSSPIQNIGAYGAEVKNTLSEVTTYNTLTGKTEIISNAACMFGYRSSIFKTSLKNSHIITAVTFRLNKNPIINNTYDAVNKALQAQNILQPTIADIRRTICQIRESKLPDPNKTGNAGSFFKNPEISCSRYKQLKIKYTDLVGYELGNGNYKLAAGWLIEKSGWKGYREGDAGVHDKQALVLVNYGHATGSQILSLAEKIRKSVLEKFNIPLEFEVNIL
ncbi:MAG: UDP-N-acetylenolpyruvoylglucosamine reductase [Bacteroidetes bacterium ADurb.Bin408]|nr:MAG: UDP-N-acetylenolpyruvoylglucosamine reductase [Bacteroidetes bacterium ADurb.Bin408]